VRSLSKTTRPPRRSMKRGVVCAPRTPKTQNNFILVRTGGYWYWRGVGIGRGSLSRSGTDRRLARRVRSHDNSCRRRSLCLWKSRLLEVYASAAGGCFDLIRSRSVASGETPPRFIEIVARAREGEVASADHACTRVGQNLGSASANVITGLGVSRVLISGQSCTAGCLSGSRSRRR